MTHPTPPEPKQMRSAEAWKCWFLNKPRKETLEDFIRAIQADAIASCARVPEWLPIESAPRDRAVILYAPENNFYSPSVKISSFWNDRWHAFDKDHQPTHWMPLPKPPKDKP